MARIRCSHAPSSPTATLASSVAKAMAMAGARQRRAVSPATSSSAPATGPNTTGIHSLPRSEPLMLCAR